jgi:hypothetical protein
MKWLYLQMFLELSRDDHMKNYTRSLLKIIKNHPYTNSSKFSSLELIFLFWKHWLWSSNIKSLLDVCYRCYIKFFLLKKNSLSTQFDSPPSSLLDPKRGPTMSKRGSSWNLVPLPAPSNKGVRGACWKLQD